MKTFAYTLLGLLILQAVFAAPTKNVEKPKGVKQTPLFVDAIDGFDEDPYYQQQDPYPENREVISVYYDYEDEPKIEIGTLTPGGNSAFLIEEDDYEELIPHEPLDPGAPSVPGLLDPESKEGLPTCLLCTCLGGSVYCDDTDIESIPPLPKDTTHFYARFNKLTKISKQDFAGLNNLKRIDLTGNKISSIDEDSFRQLPELVELTVASNEIVQIPELPNTMVSIDASHNKVHSRGIKKETFKDMANLAYLFLSDNELDYVPLPLPEGLRSVHLQNNNIQHINDDTFCNSKDINYVRKPLQDIRLDGNPINLSKTPQAYICLLQVPVGNY